MKIKTKKRPSVPSFEQLLNRPSSIEPSVINRSHLDPLHMELDDPPTKDEVAGAIAEMQWEKRDGRHDIRCKTDPEKCKEQNMDLYILFVDLTKAFDTVYRPGLWSIICILPRIGIPPNGELTEGLQPRGRPKLRYKDTLNKSLQKCDIDEEQWEFLAINRSEWRQAIRKGTEVYENERQVSQVKKRAAITVMINSAERSIKCSLCSGLCTSDFGLRSHMRVHK
ncbi:hypothetical protein ACOMHN_019654 [Nucella lapillus]